MKKFAVNVLATTGISLLILSIVALCYNAGCLYIRTVFEALGANLAIHLCLLLLHQFELKYPILEMALEVLIVIAISIVLGAVFRWFTSIHLWVLIIMGAVIYVVSLILNAMTMKQEAQKINTLIKKRNKH